MSTRVWFSCVGLTFEVDCHDSATELLALRNFGAGEAHHAPAARYTVSQTDEHFTVRGPRGEVSRPTTDSELLYVLEKSITLEAQRLRPSLYFVHGAAVEFEGCAVLLIGDPGAGKSTLTWALLHHGFSYLSDELAPIDEDTLSVYPYAHAICLKNKPPAPYALPEGTLFTSSTIHIPVRNLPGVTKIDPQPIGSLVFVRYDPLATDPLMAPLSKAEGAARLYSNTLNLLAHRELGLDTAASIANRCACFTLTSALAAPTCGLLKDGLTA